MKRTEVLTRKVTKTEFSELYEEINGWSPRDNFLTLVELGFTLLSERRDLPTYQEWENEYLAVLLSTYNKD